MKETYWGYWLIVLGILIIGVMFLVNNTSTSSNNDYYTIKEVTQAAMIDAVDMSYYRLWGDVMMSEQKFVENFLRRFADNTALSDTYTVEFFDLYEVPPKVSIRISTKSNSYNIAYDPTSFDVVTTMDAILEVGVPDGDEGPSKKTTESKCSLTISGRMHTLLKQCLANRSSCSDKNHFEGMSPDKALSLADAWESKDPDLTIDGLVEVFRTKYHLLETGTDTYELRNSTYPELDKWMDEGLIY